jgi:hypothetical protein
VKVWYQWSLLQFFSSFSSFQYCAWACFGSDCEAYGIIISYHIISYHCGIEIERLTLRG